MIQEEVRGTGLDLAVSRRGGEGGASSRLACLLVLGPVATGQQLGGEGAPGNGLFVGTLTGSSVSLVLD